MGRPKGSPNRGQPPVYCHRCKREICGYVEGWGYKRMMKMAGQSKVGRHIFCSWSCLCAAEREAEAFFGPKPDKYERVRENRLARDRKYQASRSRKKKAQEAG